MVGFTYTSLTEALVDWTEDDATEYLDAIPAIIMLGETRCLRDLNTTFFDDIYPVGMTSGSALVAKPANTVAIRDVHYVNASGQWVHLNEVDLTYARWYAPNPNSTGTPVGWYEEDTEFIGIYPTPDFNYTAQLRAFVRPLGLSVDLATTWLSTRMPDLLFYACILESERFLKFAAQDLARLTQYQQDYNERILPMARMEMSKQQRVSYDRPRVVTDVGDDKR